MIFVLAMLFTFVYDRKNENHWSLLITRNTNTPNWPRSQVRQHNSFRIFKFAKLLV